MSHSSPTILPMRRTAVLLVAHGSRHPDANADLFHLAEQLRRRRQYDIVESSFLELAEPDIATAGKKCVELGAQLVILLPYFLSAGVHVQRDLAEACRRLTEQHAGVDFRLAEPLGRHPLLLDVVLERCSEAVSQQ